MAKPIGKRVEHAEILCENCLTPRYEPIQPDQTYTVVISEFLKNGGDKFDMFQKGFSNATKLGKFFFTSFSAGHAQAPKYTSA